MEPIGGAPLKRWEGFDEVDEATLALRQLIPGENKDIAVVRVSPRTPRRCATSATGR